MMFFELKNARQFCEVLREASEASLKAGEITRREHRMVSLFSRMRPRRTQDVMEFVQDQAVAAGMLDPGGLVEAIDWEKLRDFIKTWLPLIIQFIQALFLFF